MGKTCSKGNYPNAAEKDEKYGSIIVVSSVGSTYGGESTSPGGCRNRVPLPAPNLTARRYLLLGRPIPLV